MGMTIEESIDLLDNLVGFVEDNQGNDYDGALVLSINIMRKYQKIENIVDAYITDNPREPMYDTEDYMQSIREVVEDGNDTTNTGNH